MGIIPWELIFQLLVLIFLAVLVFKAVEIRDLLESLNVKVGVGADKILEKL